MVLDVPSSPTLTGVKSRSTFRLIAQTQEDEDNFDYVQQRKGVKFTGVVGSGAGILGGHVAYMKAGVYTAVPLTVAFGLYMGYCLYLLVHSAQIMYRRTTIPSMSYPDVGEAAVSCFPNPRVARFSKPFRYLIDSLIILDLFGACACYQIIIAKSIKQLVENTHATSLYGLSVFCIGTAVFYAFRLNPTFSNMKPYGKLSNVFEFTGIIVFGMSCAGVVLPVENNMTNPKKFPLALAIGMTLIVMCTFCVAFFGYAGFSDKCDSPITVNFPMTIVPKVLKGLIAIMLFITHALNFWVPFNLCFHYIQRCHNQNRLLMWELIYRALFVILIGMVAIAFPCVNALMGFIGAFCLTNMAFIWPNIINLLIIWHRPGLGMYKWRMWRNLSFIVIGVFILVCGSIVNGKALISVFISSTK